jgi:hypothetical protein
VKYQFTGRKKEVRVPKNDESIDEEEDYSASMWIFL